VCGLDSSDLQQGPMADPSDHINEASGSVKVREFFDQVSN
jgi:hypothetical protein